MKGDLNRSVALRPVGPDDEAFLLDVYASARADELNLTPWDETQKDAFVKMQYEAQRTHYREKFPEAAYDVILLNGERAGRLYVLRAEAEDHIEIMDITLLRQYRNQGIATQLMRSLMDEARAHKKSLRIYVETFNPSLELFKQLGFAPIEEQGFNYLLEWRPVE